MAKQMISYECIAFIALLTSTLLEDANTHPESFCLLCKRLMERTINAIMKGVRHKCTVSVALSNIRYNVIYIMVHRYVSTSVHVHGHTKRSKVESVHQAGISPNKLIFRRLHLSQLYCISLVQLWPA